MIHVVYSPSGKGKSGMIAGGANRKVLMMTPDSDRAKKLRAELRAEDRISVLRCRDLFELEQGFVKHGDKFDGYLLVDDFRQMCNASAARLTRDKKGRQMRGGIKRGVYGTMKRVLVAALARLAGKTTFITTQTDFCRGGLLGPAAGTRNSVELLLEIATSVVPLASPADLLRFQGGEEERRGWDDDDDEPKKGKKGKKGKRGDKAAEKENEKGGWASETAPRESSVVAPNVRDLAYYQTHGDWMRPRRWDVVADLTNEVMVAQHPHYSGILPPFGPLLFEGLLEARRDPEALQALEKIRARELSIRESGYSRLYLHLQQQAEMWGDYAPFDDEF